MTIGKAPLTTPIPHEVTLWRRPVEGSVRAECKCGWRGRRRMSDEVALRDHEQHQVTVKRDRTHA